jgi:glycosidase
MTDAMLYWVRETDIDGFRCDVAGKVPTPFWNQARAELDRVKPVFMLAEADKPDLHEHAFDMTYGWDTKDLFKDIAKGKKDARALKDFLAHPPKAFPPGAYRMRFTSATTTRTPGPAATSNCTVRPSRRWPCWPPRCPACR